MTNEKGSFFSYVLLATALFAGCKKDDDTGPGDNNRFRGQGRIYSSLSNTRKNIRQAVIRVSGTDLSKYTFNNNGLIEN